MVWLALVFDAYRRHEGKCALEFALKINMPELWFGQLALAVAESSWKKWNWQGLLSARCYSSTRISPPTWKKKKWFQPEMVSQIVADLRAAGPDDAPEERRELSSAVSKQTASGETRGDEGFWVAVLPFKYNGANADLTALAEELSDEIVTGLSRFSYLRMLARNSTARYAGQPVDVRTAGKELGAR